MSTAFWIRRFFTVLAIAFAVIGAGQLLRGHTVADAALQAAVWSMIAASVFTTTRVVRARRGQHCALCKDTPELQDPSSR